MCLGHRCIVCVSTFILVCFVTHVSFLTFKIERKRSLVLFSKDF